MRGVIRFTATVAFGVVLIHEAQSQTLDTVLATNDTAMASLQYLRCQFTTVNDFPPPGRPKSLTGELTWGPGVLLVTAKGQNFGSVFLARPGRFEVVTTYPRGRAGVTECQSIITPTRKVHEDVNPLRDMMLVFNLEDALTGRGGTLTDYVKTHCSKDFVDDGVEVRVPYAKSSGSVRLSKRHNFLATGSESSKST